MDCFWALCLWSLLVFLHNLISAIYVTGIYGKLYVCLHNSRMIIVRIIYCYYRSAKGKTLEHIIHILNNRWESPNTHTYLLSSRHTKTIIQVEKSDLVHNTAK